MTAAFPQRVNVRVTLSEHQPGLGRVCVCARDLLRVSPGTGAGWLFPSCHQTLTQAPIHSPSTHRLDPSITFKNTLGETLSSTPNLTISASHWKRYFSDLSLFVTPGIGFVFRKYFPIELSIRIHFVLLRLQWFRWQHRAFRPQHRCCFSVCSAEWFQDMRDEPASNWTTGPFLPPTCDHQFWE